MAWCYAVGGEPFGPELDEAEARRILRRRAELLVQKAGDRIAITRIRREMMPLSLSEQSPPAQAPVENPGQSRPPDPGRQPAPPYQDSRQPQHWGRSITGLVLSVLIGWGALALLSYVYLTQQSTYC